MTAPILPILLTGGIPGGMLGWWLAKMRATAMRARDLTAMRHEIKRWQEVAERATAKSDRIAHEAKTWAEGCRQGREEVISIVPLLLAAQQRPSDQLRAAADGHLP